jgi:hypothetical protein
LSIDLRATVPPVAAVRGYLNGTEEAASKQQISQTPNRKAPLKKIEGVGEKPGPNASAGYPPMMDRPCGTIQSEKALTQ